MRAPQLAREPKKSDEERTRVLASERQVLGGANDPTALGLVLDALHAGNQLFNVPTHPRRGTRTRCAAARLEGDQAVVAAALAVDVSPLAAALPEPVSITRECE